MKRKLLRTLLTILPLTATPLIAASCGSTKSPVKKKEKEADITPAEKKPATIITKNLATQIKNKITTTTLSFGYQQSSDVTNPTTAAVIKAALKTANPTLTTADLSKITLSGGPLVAGTPTKINANINVTTDDGKFGNIAKLTVNMAKLQASDLIINPASTIKKKITTASLDLAYQQYSSVTNLQTSNAIKAALQNANPTLTNDDLGKITFASATLIQDQRVDVVANIAKDGFGNKITLKIKMAFSPANVIKNKITTTTLSLAYQSNPDVTNPTTESAIKTALKAANSTLTNDDLAKIRFNSATLRQNQSVNVVAVITASGTSARVTLSIKMAFTPAIVIKNKITDKSFNLAYQSNPDVTTSATANAIKAALKLANPTLTDADLAKIQFNSATLLQNQSVNVVAVITASGTTARVTLSIKMAFSPANIIKNKITNTTLSLGYQRNPDVTNPTTSAVIKAALKAANSSLTNDDLSKIRFNRATLLQNQSVNVVAVITAGGSTANITLSIKMAWSPASLIKNKITTTSFNVTWGLNRSITNPPTLNAIKVGLKAANPTLTNGDINKMTFSGGPLVPGTPVNITATITDQGTTATVVLKVTMQGQLWAQSSGKGIPTNANILNAPVKINNVYYLSTDGQGLFTSTDGVNWNRNNASGIPTNIKIRTAVTKIGNTYYLATYGSGLYQTNNGRSWFRSFSLPRNLTLNKPPVQIGNTLYLTTLGNGLYTSTSSTSWTQSSGKGIATNARIITKVVALPAAFGSTNYYLGLNNGGLYTSYDGTNWNTVSARGIPTNANIFSAPVKIGNTYYLATGENSTSGTGDGLYTSTDGDNWTRSSGKGLPTTVIGIVPPVVIDGIYYLSTYKTGLWTSSDGQNWSRAAAAGIPNNLNSESQVVKIGNTWFWGTVGGGLYTSTNGRNWSHLDARGIPNNANIYSVPVKIGDTWYLGINGLGLYTSKAPW